MKKKIHKLFRKLQLPSSSYVIILDVDNQKKKKANEEQDDDDIFCPDKIYKFMAIYIWRYT
ncbi:hypothetical protein DERF_012246 [Dermatophagoides farinae]|uniref:Uncharacterized protein n=1 Tax=Dermatophagoides farinae TaxID=6954 RepID=A0A922HPJ8_DERFA|nr:hypothetical protein DERF_012246 [Dermatophagoides farinae]